MLLVGVGGEPRTEAEGLIERAIQAAVPLVVWSGVEFGSRSSELFLIADGCTLPFSAQAFDLVYSNAVIEHVGDESRQREFVDEHRRVGKHWVTTTPNRWFPVESHTMAFFKHWSPRWRASRPEFTRLLSLREFKSLCGEVYGHWFSATFTGTGVGSR